jgi:hypothetical protein
VRDGVDLFAGRATEQAGSNAREGGSDASAFGALFIHSPDVLERTLLFWSANASIGI